MIKIIWTKLSDPPKNYFFEPKKFWNKLSDPPKKTPKNPNRGVG